MLYQQSVTMIIVGFPVVFLVFIVTEIFTEWFIFEFPPFSIVDIFAESTKVPWVKSVFNKISLQDIIAETKQTKWYSSILHTVYDISICRSYSSTLEGVPFQMLIFIKSYPWEPFLAPGIGMSVEHLSSLILTSPQSASSLQSSQSSSPLQRRSLLMQRSEER